MHEVQRIRSLLLPKRVKKKATMADVIQLADNDAKRCSEEYESDEIEYCWRVWRYKYKPALLHFMKRHGIQAVIKVIRTWKRSFLSK